MTGHDKEHKQTIIDTWKTENSPDYAYYQVFEDHAPAYWRPETIFRQMFDRLDQTSIVEVACGQGRHAANIVDTAGKLWLMDTSVDAIKFVEKRFEGKSNVVPMLSETGDTIDLPDNSVTAIFSYDAMVHFELTTIGAYFYEAARILVPGGRALFHHSAYDAAPARPFKDNPGWRNFMSKDVIIYFASRAGLEIEEAVPSGELDQVTLLRKPG